MESVLQSDFSVKVKGQSNSGKQMEAQAERHAIPSLTSEGGTKWHINSTIDKSKRYKYIQKQTWFTRNIHMQP